MFSDLEILMLGLMFSSCSLRLHVLQVTPSMSSLLSILICTVIQQIDFSLLFQSVCHPLYALYTQTTQEHLSACVSMHIPTFLKFIKSLSSVIPTVLEYTCDSVCYQICNCTTDLDVLIWCLLFHVVQGCSHGCYLFLHCSLQSHFNGMQFWTIGFSSLSRPCRHSRDSPMQPSTSISLCSSSSLTVPNFTAWLLSSR